MNKKTLYTSLAALALLSFQAKGFADENTSTSSWVAAKLSGGFPIYADRVILTEATMGEVLYDGSTDGMSGWSDLLVRLGLPADLKVRQGVNGIDGKTVHYGSVELPKSEEGVQDVATARNELLLELDASNLTDEQKSELAEKIAFAETVEELAKLKDEFIAVTTLKEKEDSVVETQPRYSHTEKAQADKKARSEKALLPSTGESDVCSWCYRCWLVLVGSYWSKTSS